MAGGVPLLNGEGLKAGRHDAELPVPADAELASFGAEPTNLGDLPGFLQQFLPRAGKLRTGRICEYDVTPDDHFIIDTVPACPNVQVSTSLSRHGFKFASAIRADLLPFSDDRFAGAAKQPSLSPAPAARDGRATGFAPGADYAQGSPQTPLMRTMPRLPPSP